MKWEETVQLSSIPLVQLDKDKSPIGMGSGCWVNYRGRRFLISVFHVTHKDNNWAIELRYSKDTGTTLYYLGYVSFIAEMKLGDPRIRDVDFSYAEIPSTLDSFFQDLTPDGQILNERKRMVFHSSLDDIPRAGEKYGFSGRILSEFHKDIQTLVARHHTYLGMTYLRTDGQFHEFKIPGPHPGHKYFRGCSGAPIIDTKGRVVSLVSGGRTEDDVILGINLTKYKIAIDATYFMT